MHTRTARRTEASGARERVGGRSSAPETLRCCKGWGEGRGIARAAAVRGCADPREEKKGTVRMRRVDVAGGKGGGISVRRSGRRYIMKRRQSREVHRMRFGGSTEPSPQHGELRPSYLLRKRRSMESFFERAHTRRGARAPLLVPLSPADRVRPRRLRTAPHVRQREGKCRRPRLTTSCDRMPSRSIAARLFCSNRCGTLRSTTRRARRPAAASRSGAAAPPLFLFFSLRLERSCRAAG